MESLHKLANELAQQGTLITATISGRRKTGETDYSKVQIKPVEIKKACTINLLTIIRTRCCIRIFRPLH